MTIRVSRFARSSGILLAADLDDEISTLSVIDQVRSEIIGVKLGNALLYRVGAAIISRIKAEFELPVIVDAKITDVGHIAERVASFFSEAGADAITISGVCGPTVVSDALKAVNESCEIWLFTEFTTQDGLLDEDAADLSARLGLGAGASGFQAPGNRPDRVQDLRKLVGDDRCIMSCGMGTQGGKIGAAISAGANFEIIGRSIYRAPDPLIAAKRFRDQLESTAN